MTNKKKSAKKSNARPARSHQASGSVGSATAASILGQVSKSRSAPKNGEVKVKPEWEKYYRNLMELRDQLLHQMDGLAKESAEQMAGYSLHMADSGTDNFDRDFALSLLSSDQDAVYEIEEAIKRIERNNYGICELTGKPIPKARLTAIPWTRFTVEAQAQLERDGAIRSRRLGSLGSVDSTGSSSIEIEEEEDSSETKSAAKNKDKD